MACGTGCSCGRPLDLDVELASADRLFTWVDDVQRALALHEIDDAIPGAPSSPRPTPVRTWSDRVDRVLLDPWFGVPVFLAVMWALFQLATTVAAPLMGAVSSLVDGPVASGVRAALPGPHWVESFVVDGVLAGLSDGSKRVEKLSADVAAYLESAEAAADAGDHAGAIAVLKQAKGKAHGLQDDTLVAKIADLIEWQEALAAA